MGKTTIAKKMLAGFCCICLLAVGITDAVGENGSSSDTLNLIKQDTGNILNQVIYYGDQLLQAISSLPIYIGTVADMSASWIEETETTENKNQFSTLQGTITLANLYGQQGLAQTATNAYNIDQYLFNITTPTTDTSKLPLAQPADLMLTNFTSASPVYNPNPDQPPNVKNYLSYLTGYNMHPMPPAKKWSASDTNAINYTNLYNTLMAIQSFNNYVVSQYLTNTSPQLFQPNGVSNSSNSTSPMSQANLIAQANNSDWSTAVQTLTLGMVLRYILFYTSQSYVQLNQIYTVEQQMLTAQAMTNTLLSTQVNQLVGQYYYNQAK